MMPACKNPRKFSNNLLLFFYFFNKTKPYGFIIIDPDTCPVQLFKLYMMKLHPANNALWQKSKDSMFHYTDETWYEN